LKVIALSENEKDYSAYLQVVSNTLNILVLLSGFTFTGITILLSLFPVLGSLTVQFILFFLSSLLFLFMFLLTWLNAMLMRFCRNRPPVTREIAGFNRLTIFGYVLLQLAVVLMFLVWNLAYLSLASGVVLALFVIIQIREVKRMGRLHRNEGEDQT
jgi:hypothetical protein